MNFKDRVEAGNLLAQALKAYQGQEVVVYALPRGGVVTAFQVAKALKAPLDVLLAHKIGHPFQPEYAIAAISEGGYVVENVNEVASVDGEWYEKEKLFQMNEIRRRRALYLKGRESVKAQGKIAIIVDDGVATGLTMQATIKELRHQNPKKIVVAVPVSPKNTALFLKNLVDDFVGIEVPEDHLFRGAIGAYYREFPQVEDSEVISILEVLAKKELKP